MGPGATWKSSTGRESRIDFLGGPPTLLRAPMDTWVARDLDVATIRDDHYPVVVKLLWHAAPLREAVSWHTPIMNRIACVEGPAAEAFKHALSLLSLPPPSTPVDAIHAYL